jgi:hypothetical protein
MRTTSLSTISCTAEEACTAVGHDVNSAGTEVTLAERWNGKTWAIQETANPTGAKSSSLVGAVCTAVGSCISTGHYSNSSGTELALGESWNGTAWSIAETPAPKEASGSLPGVSCTAAEACTAAGHYLNSKGAELTLAEGWNGKEWSLQETITPTGAKSSSLAGVSCTSSEACTAVGHYVNSSSVEVTLAERWNGKTWAIQETPNPEAKSVSLSGVSCASSAACMATGHSIDGVGTEAALVEEYN